MDGNTDLTQTQGSIPVYFGQWGHGLPVPFRKGTMAVSGESVSLTSEKGLGFTCRPEELTISEPFPPTFQANVPSGRFVIAAGSSWLARTRLGWLSKDVRFNTQRLLSELQQVGIALPPSLAQIITKQ